MKSIHPDLFTQVMQLPQSARTDLLEFLGATPVEDALLRQMIQDVTTYLKRCDEITQSAA